MLLRDSINSQTAVLRPGTRVLSRDNKSTAQTDSCLPRSRTRPIGCQHERETGRRHQAVRPLQSAAALRNGVLDAMHKQTSGFNPSCYPSSYFKLAYLQSSWQYVLFKLQLLAWFNNAAPWARGATRDAAPRGIPGAPHGSPMRGATRDAAP